MTKEELEKEALVKYKTGSYPQLHPDHFAFIHGYLAAAEPRENRITELEKEKCELLGIIQGKDKAIADLKKENAELKKSVKYVNTICERKSLTNSQLTELAADSSAKLCEAKEIIKDLLGLKSSISSAKEAERRFVIREKAKKFLEEKEGD